MKSRSRILGGALVSLLVSVNAVAEKGEAGPRGGRLLENTSPRAEFLVLEDRKVSVAFVREDKKIIPPTTQEVVARVSHDGKQSTLNFKRVGDELISESPLPEGEGYTVALQVKANSTARPENFRITYESHICGGCNRPEYACTCDE